MTRKDYKLIAETFAELLKGYGNQEGMDRDDAYFCRFDIDKFLKACHVQFELDALGK
jgi:hypothetical protein